MERQWRSCPEWQARIQQLGDDREALWHMIQICPHEEYRERLINHARTVVTIKRRIENPPQEDRR